MLAGRTLAAYQWELESPQARMVLVLELEHAPLHTLKISVLIIKCDFHSMSSAYLLAICTAYNIW